MTIESDLRVRLVSQTALTNLVGTRIYPLQLPQNGQYPAIAYWRVSAPRVRSMGNGSKTIRARYQFDVYAESYKSAKTVVAALIAAIDWYSGTKTVVIEHIEVLDDPDIFDDGDELYHIPVDALVVYKEI